MAYTSRLADFSAQNVAATEWHGRFFTETERKRYYMKKAWSKIDSAYEVGRRDRLKQTGRTIPNPCVRGNTIKTYRCPYCSGELSTTPDTLVGSYIKANMTLHTKTEQVNQLKRQVEDLQRQLREVRTPRPRRVEAEPTHYHRENTDMYFDSDYSD